MCTGMAINPRHLPPPRILNSPDLAVMLDCTVETACSYMRRGLLPGVKLGGRWRASREEVVARIEALSDSRCSCGAATSWPPAGVDATGRPVCSRCAGGAA